MENMSLMREGFSGVIRFRIFDEFFRLT